MEKRNILAFESFKKYQVIADSIEDFCNRYHKHSSYHDKGKDYIACDLQSHQEEFEKFGFTFIPHHDSVSGEIVTYYGSNT